MSLPDTPGETKLDTRQDTKIIFAGPVGSGKTTAIACLSEIPVVSTDVAASDETLARKATTTVAMDYGFITLEDGSYVHLYGTPGQDRFDFMWQILVQGGIGLVLLVDAARPDPAADMAFYLDAFRDFIRETGVVIGLTRTDLAGHDVFGQLLERLQDREEVFPILEVDAREGEDVRILVQTLLAILEAEAAA
jgi:uncharacterized protein